MENRFILGGVFSHGTKEKTNTAHKGKWTDRLRWGPASILFWNVFNDLSCLGSTCCLWRHQFPSFKTVSSSLNANPHQHTVRAILGVITDKLTLLWAAHAKCCPGPCRGKRTISLTCSEELTGISRHRRLIKKIEMVRLGEYFLLFNRNMWYSTFLTCQSANFNKKFEQAP